MKPKVNNEKNYTWEDGCSCLDSAYERKAIDEGMNTTPVFDENREYMGKVEEFLHWYSEKYGNKE